MDPASLWKRIVLKAALSPVVLVSWAGAVGATAWLHNPAPLLVCGGLSVVWILAGSRSARYRNAVLADVEKEREAEATAERSRVVQQVGAQLDEPPLRGWIQSGMLPDYLRIYRRLVEIRERVTRVATERREVEAVGREEMIQQLDGMLGSYLQFVRERISYLQILNNIRVGGDADGVSPKPPPALPASSVPGWATTSTPPQGFEAGRWQRIGTVGPAGEAPRPEAPEGEPSGLPSFERRLTEVEGKIARLRELAEQEPSTAKTRAWHVGILEKQRDLLCECRERDRHVVAQLGVFTDVFEVILGRVSAAQFSPGEIVSSMAPVVEQIEQTEQLIATLRPAMEELMGTVGEPPPLARLRG